MKPITVDRAGRTALVGLIERFKFGYITNVRFCDEVVDLPIGDIHDPVLAEIAGQLDFAIDNVFAKYFFDPVKEGEACGRLNHCVLFLNSDIEREHRPFFLSFINWLKWVVGGRKPVDDTYWPFLSREEYEECLVGARSSQGSEAIPK